MLSKPTLLAMLALSSFGLAGCDQVKSALANIGRSMGMNPMTMVIEPGTILNAGGQNVMVFGYSLCPGVDTTPAYGNHSKFGRCAIIEPDTVSVDVTYVSIKQPDVGMPEMVRAAWSVKHDGDKVSLRTERGDLVLARE